MIIAQRHAHEFVIPRQRPLDVEHAQLFLIRNADGSIGQQVDALQIGQVRRQDLHRIIMSALLILAKLKVLQPHAGTLSRRNRFSLVHLAVSKQNQVKGG